MRKMIINLIALMLSFGFSCTKINQKDDVLTLNREDYLGSALKLEGIYYMETENSNGLYFQRYALYRNGIIRDLGGSDILDSPNFLTGNSKADWGVFQVNVENIKFERWYPSSGGPLKAFVREGKILNDTTFQITESYRMQGGKKTEVREEDEMYHFRTFSPKPDSTNPYIP